QAAMDRDKKWKQFNEGTLDVAEMPTLITQFTGTGDKQMAQAVAGKYINSYLLKLPDEKLFIGPNIQLMATYIIETSGDEGTVFELFRKRAITIDSDTKQGYAAGIVQYAIFDNEIAPRLWRQKDRARPISNKPDWQAMTKETERKFGSELVEKIV